MAVHGLHEVGGGGVAVALLLVVLRDERRGVLVVQDEGLDVVAVVRVVLQVAVVAVGKLCCWGKLFIKIVKSAVTS